MQGTDTRRDLFTCAVFHMIRSVVGVRASPSGPERSRERKIEKDKEKRRERIGQALLDKMYMVYIQVREGMSHVVPVRSAMP